MKLEDVIIFMDGDLLKVKLEYFFQDSKISSITKKNVLDIYTNQKVFLHSVKSIIQKNQKDPKEIINLLKIDRMALPKLERGLSIIEGMVMDMHGDKEVSEMLSDINDIVTEEC